MQMVSIALCSEMETEPCCEEQKDSAEEATEPKVRADISEFAERDTLDQLSCGPGVEGEEHCRKEQVEAESCVAENKDPEIKSLPDPGQNSGGTECKEQKKLRKSNSWKMVRFQDPSTEDDVLERDSSAQILFPEYAVEEWTSKPFEQLFLADDWENITGKRYRPHYYTWHW